MNNHIAIIAIVLVGVIFLIFLRHSIVRLLLSTFWLFVGLMVLGLCVGFGMVIHRYFGTLTAIISTTVLVCIFFYVGRNRVGSSNIGNDEEFRRRYREGNQDQENARRRRDEQLREDRRIQQASQDAIRRNPW
jgi:uncharacterized membrane protein